MQLRGSSGAKKNYIYFIYLQFKQTNIINTEIINTNTKLIQIQNLKLELLQSVYNCTWIWSKVFKKLVKDHFQESTSNYVK